MASTNDIPEEFICPITQTLMRDPYVDKDGNCYEKAAIMDWLRRNPVSPITRNRMSVNDIFPNRTLKSVIESFRLANPDLCGPADSKDEGAEGKDSTDSKDDKTTPLNPTEARRQLGRKPFVLFAVIDVSGSMQNPCDSSTGYDGGREQDGFSRLDLVKHTLNTIIKSLSSSDQICIIKFSTSASVYIPLTRLTEAAKPDLIARVNDLEPEGQTNIWDGMRVAVDQVAALHTSYIALPTADAKSTPSTAAATLSDLNVHIYLLTDGEPTINPPSPLDVTVQGYLAKKCVHGIYPVISTFGYGYQLDSVLLYSLANLQGGRSVGGGIFGFIPDASMVGTVFINALANSLFMLSGKDFITAPPTPPYSPSTAAIMTQLYATLLTTLQLLVRGGVSHDDRREALEELRGEVARAMARYQRADDGRDLVDLFLTGLLSDISPSSDDSDGQIAKATQREYVNKWGLHYLRSVLMAYVSGYTLNFKDKGLKVFQEAYPVLLQERERIEEIFVQLPPPPQSIRAGSYYDSRGHSAPYGSSTRGGAPAPAPVQSMARYYNVSGGCLTADTLVCMAGGERKMVKDLKRGEVVISQDGVTTIKGVVSMPYSGMVYKVGECVGLTPYHPVLLTSASGWADYFPLDLYTQGVVVGGRKVEQVHMHQGRVYDVILENRSILQCPLYATPNAPSNLAHTLYLATLGHNCSYPTFVHPYFGAYTAIQDVYDRFGCKDGLGQDVWEWQEGDKFVRNVDGLVVGVEWGKGRD